jgi:hypothetical protein
MRLLIATALSTLVLASAAVAHDHGGDAHHDMKRRTMDANGDGQVTREEFMAPHAEMFASLDTDKNGTLSKAEIGDHHIKIMRKHAEKTETGTSK